MTIEQYTKVRVLVSRFEHEGVPLGTVGWVIEIHEDDAGEHYEVEVMDEGGRAIAFVVADEFELEALQDASAP